MMEELFKMKKAYACINKDERLRMKETSGGAFSSMAKYVLGKDGTVYAAVYDDNMNVVHKKVADENELHMTYGAKYAASVFTNCFPEIKINLQNEGHVLFSGTPCQCAALKSYLGVDKEGLICIDFVCHGVPEEKCWQLYLRSVESGIGSRIKSVNMRDKTSGWSNYNYCWKIIAEDGRTLYQHQKNNLYMKGFVGNLFLQPACYACVYKGDNRASDITLGDFWGAWKTKPDFDDNKGTSLVIVRTEKGKKLFESVSEKFLFCELEENDYLPYNPSIVKCAEKPSCYKEFHRRLEEGEDIQKLIAEFTGSDYKKGTEFKEIKAFIRDIFKSKLKQSLKKIYK